MKYFFIVLAIGFQANVALAFDNLNLTGAANTGNATTIGLSWDAISGKTYKVKWKKSSAGIFAWTETDVTDANVIVGAGNSGPRWYYDVGGLTCGTSYDFKVKRKYTLFSWEDATVTTRGCGLTACTKGGTFDGANCHIGKAPTGTLAFVWAGNYYYTKKPGNQCPYPGSWYDGSHCFVQAVPPGVTPFIYQNNWYYISFP